MNEKQNNIFCAHILVNSYSGRRKKLIETIQFIAVISEPLKLTLYDYACQTVNDTRLKYFPK